MEIKIAVIGLGYVGLPLAVAFGEKYPTYGYDINTVRINELNTGYDRTREVDSGELKRAANLQFTDSVAEIQQCNVYVVTVPTPVNEHHEPDLRPLLSASKTVGKVISAGDTVIFESTVYPGATEEDCVPVIEAESGLKLNQDFYVGYSPERINPGDKQNRLQTICKVTSGSTEACADFVDGLYRSIIPAGTHKAQSIKVAEAAKVIENTQRDVNIALINELSMLFNRLGIDTEAVLQAAGSKWNFLPFRPGLVGGHCIGVDPYYLTHKAKQIGFHPEMVLAGRRINDGMGQFVANEFVKAMSRKGIPVPGSRVLVMGLTFKENCPDIRNTRVVDVVSELRDFGMQVDVIDPWADKDEVYEEYAIELQAEPSHAAYDGIILTVAHNEFKENASDLIGKSAKQNCLVFDLKHVLPMELTDRRL